jgi:hypothetical protein
MLNDKNDSTKKADVPDTVENVETVETRKVYVKPRLEEMGDLRTFTLGLTGGINESGPLSPNHW